MPRGRHAKTLLSIARRVSKRLLTPCPVLGVFLPRQPVTGAAVPDPKRHFATVDCRNAKGSFDYVIVVAAFSEKADATTASRLLLSPTNPHQTSLVAPLSMVGRVTAK
jgi:hypothetical protein